MAVIINGSTASSYWTFKLEATEGNINIANNTSPLTVDVYIGRSASAGSSYMHGASISCSVGVTGCSNQTLTYKNSGKVTIAAGGWLKIGSVTFPAVPHNADGSKTVTVSASFTNNISPSSGSASGNVKLTTIARATQPVIYTSSIDMGKNITITLPRASASFAHVLRYEFGSTKDYISGYAEDEVDWVIPLTLANSIPNAASGKLNIYCDTYNGETFIGSKSVSLTINVPADMIPTVSIATSDPTGHKNKYGAFVQGYSKFKVDVSASGVYGSTIKSYKIEADGKTYTSIPVTTDVISGKGELTIKATITDSRERASAVSGKVEVLPYEAPKISSISVYRCNEDGEKANGGYLAVVFSAEITALNNKNSAVYSIQYKKNTETDYTTEAITDYLGQYTVLNGVFIFAADPSSSYNIVLTANDDFSGTERTATGSSIKKLWSILKRGFGFAFGKIAELANTLEVALDAVFYKNVHIQGALTYDIPISHEDADLMLTSGKFYLGINAKNRPVYENGWLEVQNYGSGNYCYQRFITYTGNKYERFRNEGTWGEWIFIDYVVESGTSGIWTYEKWASGKAECWGNTNVVKVTVNTPWGSIYVYDRAFDHINYPFEFVGTPICDISYDSRGGNYWLFTFAQGDKTKTPAYSIARPNVFEVNAVASYYVVGRWK